MKKTLVIGASQDPSRYSYLAINRLLTKGHEVVAIGNRGGSVQGIPIEKATVPPTDIDTITLYVNPQIQQQYYDYIFATKPKRVIFNPGTENEALESLLREKGIEATEACTLVMLGTGQY